MTFAADEAAVHVVLPSETADALAAKVRDPSYKLTSPGELHGACRCAPTARPRDRDHRAARCRRRTRTGAAAFATALLRCARRRPQHGAEHLVVGLPAHPREWFAGVGFEEAADAPPEVSTAMNSSRRPSGSACAAVRAVRPARAGTASAPARAGDVPSGGRHATAARFSLGDAVVGCMAASTNLAPRATPASKVRPSRAGDEWGSLADGGGGGGGVESEPWPRWATERKARSLVEGEIH